MFSNPYVILVQYLVITYLTFLSVSLMPLKGVILSTWNKGHRIKKWEIIQISYTQRKDKRNNKNISEFSVHSKVTVRGIVTGL